MGSRLNIAAPADFVLARDVCSYGYFRLAPDRWDPITKTLATVLGLADGPASCTIAQSEPGRVSVIFERTLSRAEQATARAQISRMLRLHESEADLAAFHAVDPRWASSGRGRIFRSPTLFQDMIRTVTSCNVTWSGTVGMNERLCQVLGKGGAFPTAHRMARTRPGTLRGRCRVGYRDSRMIELAKMFVRGAIDESWLEDNTVADDEIYRFLLTLPGIGPYAASNMMQLLGRYAMLAVDSETLSHGRKTLGFEGEDTAVIKAVQAHYEPFGAHRFRSYWFEKWCVYEEAEGPAHAWPPKSDSTAGKQKGVPTKKPRQRRGGSKSA